MHRHRRVAFARQRMGEQLRFEGDPQGSLLDELARRGYARRQAGEEGGSDGEASHGHVKFRKACVALELKARAAMAG